jgi:DNA repair protein RadC
MLRHEPHEVFGCLFLDSKHQVLSFEALFRGSIDNTSVHPRKWSSARWPTTRQR